MYYYECPDCGCSLDPGEKCDCRIGKNKFISYMDGMIEERNNGQLGFKLLQDEENEEIRKVG